MVGQPRAEPALAAVEQQQREADDDRRDREREVDERVEHHLPPGTRPRTIASAARTPKIVFSGTAISATSIVSQNAWIAAGVVIESQTAPSPGSNVR